MHRENELGERKRMKKSALGDWQLMLPEKEPGGKQRRRKITVSDW